jgi:adenylate cyclase
MRGRRERALDRSPFGAYAAFPEFVVDWFDALCPRGGALFYGSRVVPSRARLSDGRAGWQASLLPARPPLRRVIQHEVFRKFEHQIGKSWGWSLGWDNFKRPSESRSFTRESEEIITALSRIRWLFVIARNSSFTYKGQSVDVKQVGRELGVRYVLEGSVRKAGQRVRITGQLIDAVTGAHLWADRFDGSLEDIFELQDDVASSVAGVIEPTLQVAEIRRSAERPTRDHTAYDLYLRALSRLYNWERGSTLAALDLAGQAIERDPHYGPVLATAAACRQELHVNGWTDDPELNRREGVDLARRAIRVASDDPRVLGMAAYALAYFGEDMDAAIELIDRALALNPSFAHGWVISGWLRLWAGQPELAISHFETSLRLSPHARRSGTFMAVGVGHFFARRFGDAAAMLLRSLQEHAGWAPSYRFLAACYAHMGRMDEARDAIERLKAVTSVVVPTAMHWRNPEHRELFLSGVRLAAGETT